MTTSKSDFFIPANERTDSIREHLSPSGKYKLVTARFTTKPGAWDYSQGKVFRVGSDTPIAIIQRNYGAFPFAWVEQHANGHDYLVCGEHYQGQTVIELDTGLRRDGGTENHFCWASYRYEAAIQALIVDGCYWACSYEHQFFDFSDPMNGWPRLETEESIDSDEKREPEILSDGTIRCFKTRYTEDEDEDDEETAEDAARKPSEPIVDVISTFRREGLKLQLVEEWISDFEKDKRRKWEESAKAYEAWKTNFKSSDPLYLAYTHLVSDPELSPEAYETIGGTHKDWCPDFKGYERRWCRRIITHKGKLGTTVDLEWAVESGPIKLVVFRDGEHVEDKFFAHSETGMREAFAYAKRVARS